MWRKSSNAKVKRMTCSIAENFVCGRCKRTAKGEADPVERLCDEVETVNSFCYLGDRLNASGGCEAAVTEELGLDG